jgi:hypothetical protein
MSGAVSPLPNTPSWRGAQLKHRDNFTLPYLTVYRSTNTNMTAAPNSKAISDKLNLNRFCTYVIKFFPKEWR